jgi:hypothetical protein
MESLIQCAHLFQYVSPYHQEGARRLFDLLRTFEIERKAAVTAIHRVAGPQAVQQ